MLDLQAPIVRVTGYDVPYPYWQIEDAYMPSAERVADAAPEPLEVWTPSGCGSGSSAASAGSTCGTRRPASRCAGRTRGYESCRWRAAPSGPRPWRILRSTPAAAGARARAPERARPERRGDLERGANAPGRLRAARR